jgi:hypothetical protein
VKARLLDRIPDNKVKFAWLGRRRKWDTSERTAGLREGMWTRNLSDIREELCTLDRDFGKIYSERDKCICVSVARCKKMGKCICVSVARCKKMGKCICVSVARCKKMGKCICVSVARCKKMGKCICVSVARRKKRSWNPDDFLFSLQ